MTASAAKRRAKYLQDAFNLTPSEWEKILIHQHGVCFICRRPFNPPKRRPHTDHNHNTGLIRGILCSQCNRALGKAEDPRWQWSFECFIRAGFYLKHPPAVEALGKEVSGYPGKIGTKTYRKWLKKKQTPIHASNAGNNK